MYTGKQALETIKEANSKQLTFLEETEGEKGYQVSRKVMKDNAVAIDWLIKYIEKHCPPAV